MEQVWAILEQNAKRLGLRELLVAWSKVWYGVPPNVRPLISGRITGDAAENQ
jgi:hypothetical protein